MDCEDSRKRSMDRRRETSRCAARERRGKESDVFSDLRDVVPLVDDGTIGHLDRIALLRVASTVCRFRAQAAGVLDGMIVPDVNEQKVKIWTEDTMTECLDGFLLTCDLDGSILYITESVALYLGLTQTDLCGRSLKEFFQQDDYNEFREIVGQLVSRNSEEAYGRAAVFRMKTVISPRGRNLNMKSALLKPVSFVMRIKKSDNINVVLMQGICVPAGQGSINATATALTKGSDTPSGAYMTRHTCDMRISFISERFNYILKNDLKSLMGASFYDLVYPSDCEIISKAMKELFSKGHVRTPYYRLLAPNGKLAWLMTEANTTSHTCKGQKGQYVVCVHFVIGIQEPCESLVVCTDMAPAGLPVEIKKEIDDIRDYVGRQPEVIDADNYVPLFGDDTFCVTETLRPQENGAPPACRQDSYDEVLEWLFREQPRSPCPQQEECRQSSDPTLASAQLMASVSRPSLGSSYPYEPTISGRSEGLHRQRVGSFDSRPQNYSSARSTEGYVPFNGTGSLSSSSTTVTPPSLSVIHSPDNNILPTCDQGGSPSMYTSMLAANNSDRSTSSELSTTIVEDLQWEEPDLTGLAPFVPDDDIIDFGAEALPKDLEMLFSDLPEWKPAQPMVARGQSTTIKYQQPYSYGQQNSMNNNTCYSDQSSSQYWPQQNWAPSNNFSY